jgi:phosphinothricin acetyltransferase
LTRIDNFVFRLGVRRRPGYARIMTILIRAATAADIPAITAIYAHAVRFGTASFEIDPPGEAEMGERFRALAAGGFPYLVATTDERVAGYAYAGLYRTRVAYRNTLEDSVYIDPQFHPRCGRPCSIACWRNPRRAATGR